MLFIKIIIKFFFIFFISYHLFLFLLLTQYSQSHINLQILNIPYQVLTHMLLRSPFIIILHPTYFNQIYFNLITLSSHFPFYPP